MSTPAITLTAHLEDFTGQPVGNTANPGKLRIALCGYGPLIPRVCGGAVIAKPGPFDILANSSGDVSTLIWGNDVILPAGTFYTITVLDGDDNVVQCDAYTFTGSGTIDLACTAPITPGQPAGIPELEYVLCTGAVPGTAYTAPGAVIAVAYNGVFLPRGLSLPILSYTLAGGTAITLNFSTQTEDLIYALCIVP